MEYFSIQELTYSYTAEKNGIKNTLTGVIVEHLHELIAFLNPLREAWGSAIKITSGYRCEELNRLVGGVRNSAHLTGYAADLYPTSGCFTQFVEFLKTYLSDKQFDQCIIESSGKSRWVHLSIEGNRRQLFTLVC